MSVLLDTGRWVIDKVWIPQTRDSGQYEYFVDERIDGNCLKGRRIFRSFGEARSYVFCKTQDGEA